MDPSDSDFELLSLCNINDVKTVADTLLFTDAETAVTSRKKATSGAHSKPGSAPYCENLALCEFNAMIPELLAAYSESLMTIV